MSVFATGTQKYYLRNIAVFVIVCAAVAGSILTGRVVLGPLTAMLRAAVATVSPSPALPPTETVFPQPKVVDWEGAVFGVLSGGRGLAVRRSDTREMFQAYFADGQTSSVSEGPVRIHGHWTGISCAYENTVFNGTCTPSVDIDALEILPISLE